MAELLAELPDCDASDRALTATDLGELEPPSKKKKTCQFSYEGRLDDSRSDDVKRMFSELFDMLELLSPSSENEGGVDDSRSNDDGWMPDDSHELGQLALFPMELEPPFSGKSSSENEGRLDDRRSDGDKRMFSELFDMLELLSPSSENEGGVDDSRSNDDGWMPDDSHELGQLALFPMELEPPFSGKSSSENEGRLDDRRSNGDIWMTNKAGLLSPPPPHSLSLDLPLGTYDSQVSIQYWNKLGSNGSVDREDNHDNHVSSENEDRLLDCRRYDGLLLKLTLPVSSTEIGKESNEINGVEGSREVHPVAGKCPIRHPNAVQLLSASSSNSDCLDDISWMDGRHPSPLVLLMRDRVLKPLHLPHVGTIFGNLKHENVLMTDQLFSTQLSYIQKNNMDLLLAKSTPEAEDLFSHLLKKNPELRPEAGEVLLHPFFWNSKEKLRFLWRISDRLLLKDPAPDPDLLEELESNEPPVFNGNWIDKIDPKFKANILQRGDYYDYSSIMELLRFVRNKYVHFLELPRKIKKLVGWGDESFYNYFAARFPDLLMKSYGAASQICSEEKWFKEYHRSEISSGVLRK